MASILFNADLDINGVLVCSGAGSPEGVKTAPVGSVYMRTDAGVRTAFYIKEVGIGNTGWAEGGLLNAADKASLDAIVARTGPHLDLVPPSGEHVLTSVLGTTLTTSIGAAGRLEIFPYTPRRTHNIDRLSINVTTAVAASLAKIVVYAADPATGQPTTLLYESTDLDCSAGGTKNTATTSLTFTKGTQYWLGIRHSSTATLSCHALTSTPDINSGIPSTSAKKTLRRTVTYATPAPNPWGYLSSEVAAGPAPCVWLREA